MPVPACCSVPAPVIVTATTSVLLRSLRSVDVGALSSTLPLPTVPALVNVSTPALTVVPS